MTELLDSCRYTFTCMLANGIHARPATTLERMVSGFSSQVSIVNLTNNRQANAKSVLSLVGADIKSGDRCILKVSGEDQESTYREIVHFLEHECALCDDPLSSPTTASQTAWLPPMLRAGDVRVLFGKPAAPGLGRGKIVHAEGLRLPDGIADDRPVDVDRELLTLDSALAELERRIARRLEGAGLSATEIGVLEAHRSIVDDVELRDYIRTAVKEKAVCAGRAVLDAFEFFSGPLKTAQSELIRDRILDLQDVCSQLMRLLYGSAASLAVVLDGPSIVVADHLTPSQLMEMDKSLLSGVVLLCGGATSHTVILARSFGIPVLTEPDGAACGVKDSNDAVLDAEYGVLILDINACVERFYASQRHKEQATHNQAAAFARRAAMTRDGVQLAVMANVATAQEVAAAIGSGADGIGLFRTEMLFMGRAEAPDEAEQFAVYKKAAESADGRPVVIRTFDIGGDKPVEYLNLPSEDNPFLGFRGVRLYREYEDMFRTQLRAILRASAYGRLKIMIPMVSCPEQIDYVRGVLEQVKAQLQQAATAFDRTIPLGMMVEVPLASFMIPQLAESVDFLSIGTNDLAQYFMAVDRTNRRVADLYQCRHPGHLALIQKIAAEAHRYHLPVGLCGEMAGHIENLGLLLGAGLDSISVSIPFVSRLKAACGDYDSAVCRKMLDEAVVCRSVEQVDALQRRRLPRAAAKSVIDIALVDIDADCRSKEEAIKYACDTLFLDRRTDNPVALEQDFWQREAIYSTGLGHGFAIPHCKTKHITSDSICIFRLRRPVEWNAIDDAAVSVVIVMAIRDADDAGQAHLKLFSRLSRSIMHDAFREQIRNATVASEIVSLLCERLGLNDAS